MSSDASSSFNLTDSRAYRNNNLKRAGIFIDALSRSEWPPSVARLANFLRANNFVGTLSAVEKEQLEGTLSLMSYVPVHAVRDETVASPLGCEKALLRARTIRTGRVKSCYGKSKAEWRNLELEVMANLHAHPQLGTSRAEVWDEPVGILSGEGDPISTPKPDVAFGLLPELDSASSLGEEFLVAARLQLGLHPWPSDSLREVAYPCLLHEYVTDLEVLYFAQNRAAGTAAMALKMLRDLRNLREKRAHAPAGQQGEPLPILVFCNQGDLWEVMIAFDYEINRHFRKTDVHLAQIWMGKISNPWHMFQLQVIIQRAIHWITTVFRNGVCEMLDDIKKANLIRFASFVGIEPPVEACKMTGH
ncbi:hypothetical protein CBOM_01930 [Ceraceosorus bombacis]|uniref:Uncharacterized protein n=1 Tax=Ceraceosorus bombacis TaxID=401625 RepID=A0A0P1BDA9_9BASI|nr:hypothetical protein CBOM_01930 [Ceraceosorus bombacis]